MWQLKEIMKIIDLFLFKLMVPQNTCVEGNVVFERNLPRVSVLFMEDGKFNS